MYIIRNSKSKSVYSRGETLTKALYKLESYYRDYNPSPCCNASQNDARNRINENFLTGFFEVVSA
jgi:hypothetical protein